MDWGLGPAELRQQEREEPRAVAAAQQQILDALCLHADDIKQVQGGTWTFRLYGLGSAFQHAERITQSLCTDIKIQTGFQCVIGLSLHASVARIASEVATERGAPVVVLPNNEAAFLAPLPLAMLPGVGEKTEAALTRLGVTTIGQLATLPLDIVVSVCGPRGKQLARIAQGLPGTESAALDTVRARWQTHDQPTIEPRRLHAELYRLVEQIGRDLRTHMTATGSLALDVQWTDGMRQRETVRWPRRCDLDRALFADARRALDALIAGRRVGVVALTLTASELGPIQIDLLVEEDERGRHIQLALDGIKRRYGAGAILPAAMLPERRAA